MKIIKTELIYSGYFDVAQLTLESENGKTVQRVVTLRKDAVASIVYDTSKKLFLLVSQWRPGSKSEIIEIAAGTLDNPQENNETAMIREIEEELGYKTDELQHIDECYMSPGGSTELITIYVASVSEKIGDGGGLEEDDENITVVSMALDTILTFPFKDAKTIIAVNFIRDNKEKFL